MGAQNWTPNAGGSAWLTQSYQNVPGSGFQGTTHGGALLVQLTLPLYQGGAPWSKVSCVPVVDGFWAGHYGMAPTVAATDTTKEGWIWMGPSTPNLLWSSTKVYSGIAAGTHQFSVQCWSSATSSVLSGVNGGTTDISIASLTVLELQ